RKILEQGIDVVTFTSSSTVRNLLAAQDRDGGVLASALIACIGPTSSATARNLGLRVDLEAEKHSVEGLVKALVAHFSELLAFSRQQSGDVGLTAGG
ncbi:MAG: uroporphyrinogen-III synthase, partial [Chloroflexota bacterium]